MTKSRDGSSTQYLLYINFMLLILVASIPLYSSPFSEFLHRQSNLFRPFVDSEIILSLVIVISIFAIYFNWEKLSVYFSLFIFACGILGLVCINIDFSKESSYFLINIAVGINKYILIERSIAESVAIILLSISVVNLQKGLKHRFFRLGLTCVMFAVDISIICLLVNNYDLISSIQIKELTNSSIYSATIYFLSGMTIFDIYCIRNGKKNKNQALYAGFIVTFIFIGSWGALTLNETHKIHSELNKKIINVIADINNSINAEFLLLEELTYHHVNLESIYKEQGLSSAPAFDYAYQQMQKKYVTHIPQIEKIVWLDKINLENGSPVILSNSRSKVLSIYEKNVLQKVMREDEKIHHGYFHIQKNPANNEQFSYIVIPVINRYLEKSASEGVVIIFCNVEEWLQSILKIGSNKELDDLNVEIRVNDNFKLKYEHGERSTHVVFKSVEIKEIKYDITVAATDVFIDKNTSWMPILLLCLGVIFAAFVGVVIRAKNAANKVNNYLNDIVEMQTKDLEKSKRQLHEIIDFCADGIISTNDQGVILLFNQAAQWMFGYEGSEIIGKNVSILMRESEAEMHDEYIRNSKMTYPDIYTRESDMFGKKKNGEVFPIRVALSKIQSNEGASFVGIVVDITDQKKLEMSLLKAKEEAEISNKEAMKASEEAEKANRSKSEFLATMSHEIRTPMNGVIGMVDLLKMDSTLTVPQQKKVKVIRDSAFTLLRLIDDILDLSKIESGNMSLENVMFSVHEVVAGVIDTFSASAENKGIRLKYVIEESCPDLLEGDPVRLRQVLLNLMSNAIKFSVSESGEYQGKVTLWVSSINAQDKTIMKFEVSDNGIGISKEAQSILFQPFTQAEQNTTRRFGGTGLGLAICKKLVQMMGGEIRVDSEVGLGATFTVEIGFLNVKESTKHRSFAGQDAFVSDEGANDESFVGFIDAPKILLAEDNELNQIVMTEQLMSLNCSVTIADNGLKALNLWRIRDFDLILTDCHMPEMDGYELTKAIRREEKEKNKLPCTIIAVTANALKGEESVCFQAGMNDYISKPVELMTLKKIITKWLNPNDEESVKSERKITSEKILDESVLYSIVGDSPELHIKLKKKFLNQGEEIISKMSEAFENGDLGSVAFFAHKLKSSANSIGAKELANLCDLIEVSANSEDYNEVLLAELKASFDHVSEYIKSRIKDF